MFVNDNAPASHALERMVDHAFSPLPARVSDGRIIGVFSCDTVTHRRYLGAVASGLG